MSDAAIKKLLITAAGFIVAFVLMIVLFFKKPDILKTCGPAVRSILVFAIAFVPGVMAASICAAFLLKLRAAVIAKKSGDK